MLPLALGAGGSPAALCLLLLICAFALLQWAGNGSYVQAATRCFGFSLFVLGLYTFGSTGMRCMRRGMSMVSGDVLWHYSLLLLRSALISLLSALLGTLTVFIAQTGRRMRRKPQWYTTPLAGDPYFRRHFRHASDAALIFGCLLVYRELWRHQEALLRQASPAIWDSFMARVSIELQYGAVVVGFTVALLLYASWVALRTRQRLNRL
jgi:hypothetical protein